MIRLIFIVLLLTGCASFQKQVLMKAANEHCAHSQGHRDVINLFASEEFEPHGFIALCNCEFGQPCVQELLCK